MSQNNSAPVSAEHLHFLQHKKRQNHRTVFFRFFLFFLFIFLWEAASCTGMIDPFIFSSPTKIGRCFLELMQQEHLSHHIYVTLYETLLSFFLVTLLSLLMVILLWMSPAVSRILEPYLVVLNSLPKSALAPFLIVWLGATKTTIIVAGMSVAIFGSILNLYTCFLHTDPDKVKLIYTLHGRKRHVLTKVIIPNSIPEIISNMKVNIGLCLVGVVIGEFLAAKEGIGFLIIYSSQVFKMDWLILSIILLCIMAVGFYVMIGMVERRFRR